jgi:hypothetical protein
MGLMGLASWASYTYTPTRTENLMIIVVFSVVVAVKKQPSIFSSLVSSAKTAGVLLVFTGTLT